MKTRARFQRVVLVLAALGCGEAEPPLAPAPSEASAIRYTVQVKNLLTAQAATEGEVEAVAADPRALRGLIDAWMETPAFRGKMIEFFKQAFQQTQLTIRSFEEMVGHTLDSLSPATRARLIRSAELSFPLTVWRLIEEGRPFTEALTTERFMLNPPLMSLLAYFDNLAIDDETRVGSWLYDKFGPRFKLTLHYSDEHPPIPFAQSVDPEGPDFLTFYEPCPTGGRGTARNCRVLVTDPGQEPEDRRFRFGGLLHRVHSVVWGVMFGQRRTNAPAVFSDADWEDWRMIRVRAPRPGEEASIFWDLPRFRSQAPEQQELVVSAPRVGFLTTPAFLANWPTNLSNLARAPVNQALIVALGVSLADFGAIIPVSESGNPDAQHSAPGTTCYVCHLTLDPMRNFYRQSFSVSYHAQTRPLPPEQQQAEFLLEGTRVAGSGIRDLAAALAGHPRFARAWTQKLCQYATSVPCLDDDPELLRVAEVFRASNHDWKALVRELFSSPLVTGAAETRTGRELGGAVTISRRDHLCAALESRLGLPDVCRLEAPEPTLLQNLSFGIPGAGYTRGASTPVMPTEPSLFFSAALENLCGELAGRVVDPAECPPGQRCWRSGEAPAALDDFARVVMALPTRDPRYPEIRAILADHLGEAIAAGHDPAAALRSAFVLACTSPLAGALGI